MVFERATLKEEGPKEKLDEERKFEFESITHSVMRLLDPKFSCT